MTNTAANLDRLHDLIAPAPVPWWPPAPGWRWLLVFTGLLLLALAVKGFLRRQRNRYRREALAELGRIERRLCDSGERAAALLALAELLKRTALTAFPREQVARLHGKEWFAFLDGTGETPAFSAGLGATWESSLYDPRRTAALEPKALADLAAMVRQWIKTHQAPIHYQDAAAENSAPDGAPLPSD